MNGWAAFWVVLWSALTLRQWRERQMQLVDELPALTASVSKRP